MRLFISWLIISLLHSSVSYRTWGCYDHKCVKEETPDLKDSVGIEECKAKCLKYGGLWPKPSGTISIGNHTVFVDLSNVKFEKHEYPQRIEAFLSAAQDNFLKRVRRYPSNPDYSVVDVLNKIKVKLEIFDPSVHYFRTYTDESYALRVTPPKSEEVQVEIEASTYFGLRHGLETLAQLIYFDDVRGVYKMADEVTIMDKPEFTHRGITLDTSRSYISVSNILKVLDLMGAYKLNTFHWHITDSHSFPYVSVAYPQLSESGAYSKNQVYTQEDIKTIVERAEIMGVRVVPELDAPAHVGEGWSALSTDLITCFKWQPWRSFCVEPPCGQLDPTNDKVYEVLGTLYKEFADLFHSDLFHMGGDEVNVNCWRSTERIREWMGMNGYPQTDNGYHRLWAEFQAKALDRLKATKSDPPPQAVLWTSGLTYPDNLEKYLNPEDYIIQIWTAKSDTTIRYLVQNKYRIILSNYDDLYFDCGGPSWVGNPGQNWCSPYIGWQYVYRHSPYKILQKLGVNVTDDIKKLVLGSESGVWTEQIDNHNLHVRLWPRAAALAESLWSLPEDDWTEAQYRVNHHRERIAETTPAELLQPQWCYQNDGFCD